MSFLGLKYVLVCILLFRYILIYLLFQTKKLLLFDFSNNLILNQKLCAYNLTNGLRRVSPWMSSYHCVRKQVKLSKIVVSAYRVHLRNSVRIQYRPANSAIINYKIAFIIFMVTTKLPFASQWFFYIVQWPFMFLKET